MSQSSVLPSEKRSPSTRSLAEDRRRVLFEMDLDSELLHAGLQNGSGCRIQLLVHQVAAEVHDVHFETEVLQTARCFQSEQSSADDGGAVLAFGVLRNLTAILDECGRRTHRA